jgi:hypothetical protein
MAKLTALTESIIFSDSDQFYGVIDPGGSPLSRRIQSLTFQRYLPMPQSAITGLALSNNVTDANNDLDIAVGRVGAGTGDYNLILTSARTKQLDAAWAVGTNQGGLDTGAKAVSTWYHVWLIARIDTHVVDVLYSASVSAPTMPANYTKKRRIGAVRTDSSGNLIPFLQYGDDFFWKSPPFLDVNDATLTTAKKNYTLSGVPGGLVVTAFLNLFVTIAAGNGRAYISSPNLTDLAPSDTATPLFTQYASTTAGPFAAQVRVITDTSAQISARAGAASTTIKAVALGWTDPRGKW